MNTPVTDQTVRDQVELTEAGVQDLQNELTELEEIKLPEAVTRVSVARDHGDLSENAEYHSARVDKELIETRISQINDILSKAVVVKSTKSHIAVGMGSVVTIQKKGAKKPQIITMVGEFEADPVEGKISSASPLGKALLKKKVGDEVTFSAPPASSTTPFWILSNFPIVFFPSSSTLLSSFRIQSGISKFSLTKKYFLTLS
ncbi:Transcription elongation factor greA (Transcript cleavage factor greA) [sediment metagenome]|uniref:Transcription elongation factor GreA n=1 Tax=sediment metagenome TaxID=749907 RepID=D9PHX0_9ZZZZ